MPSLSYRPTQKDLLEACRLHDLGVVFGWRMLSLVCVYTIGVGTLACVALNLSRSLTIAGPIAGAIAISLSAFLLVLRHILLPRYLVRRSLREQRALRGELVLTWSEQGYAVRGETGSSDMNWSHYVRWRENARVILLYQTWQAYQFVPKRVLPPGAAQFIRARLRTAGVPKAPLFLFFGSRD